MNYQRFYVGEWNCKTFSHGHSNFNLFLINPDNVLEKQEFGAGRAQLF